MCSTLDGAARELGIQGDLQEALGRDDLTREQRDVIQIILSMDKDHDGTLSTKELLDLVAQMAKERRDHSLREAIDHLLTSRHNDLSQGDKSTLKILQSCDKDGNGDFSADEVMEACREIYREHSVIGQLKKAVIVQVVIIFLMLGIFFGLSMAVYELSKETSVSPTDGVMRIAGGPGLVAVATQQVSLPLSSLLYLPPVFRDQLASLTVQLADTNRYLTLKVQTTEFSPTARSFEGVSLPVIRAVTCRLTMLGKLRSPSSTNSEDVFSGTFLASAFEEALSAALPVDGLDREMQVQAHLEQFTFGHQGSSNSSGSSARRLHVLTPGRARRLAAQAPAAQTLGVVATDDEDTVDAGIRVAFRTLSRSMGTQEGLQQLLDGSTFRDELAAAMARGGHAFYDFSSRVTTASFGMEPQLTIKAHSGDEVRIFDAGHAQLRRPGGEVLNFCATCSECASQSIEDAEMASQAMAAVQDDLAALERNTGGGRRLATCEMCSGDFPDIAEESGLSESTLSMTGPQAMSCDYSLSQAGSELVGGTYVNIPNMRRFRFNGEFKQLEDYQFETKRHCIEEAWLHKYNCHRSGQTVTVSWVKPAGAKYGLCRCLRTDAAASLVASEGDSAVLTGSCNVESLPFLMLPVMVTIVTDTENNGDVSDEDVEALVATAASVFRGDLNGVDGTGVDTRIRPYLRALRRIADHAYHHDCHALSLQKAREHDPDPEVLVHIHSCSGSGKIGWGNTPTVLAAYNVMEGTPEHAHMGIWFKYQAVKRDYPDRTGLLAHEMGHIFGLKHTWGAHSVGDCSQPLSPTHSDFVPDTAHAAQLSSKSDCDVTGLDTCPLSAASADLRPLLEGADHNGNIMSYCLHNHHTFTVGQMRRMMEMVARVRPTLWLRGGFKLQATACLRSAPSVADLSVGGVDDAAQILDAAGAAVSDVSLLAGLRAKATSRTTTSGCPCKMSWTVGGQPCNKFCCMNPAADPNNPWCVTEGQCMGTNWGVCEGGEESDDQGVLLDQLNGDLETLSDLTVNGMAVSKGLKLTRIKVGGTWHGVSTHNEIDSVLAGAASTVTLEFAPRLSSLDECLRKCMDAGSCVGVTWWEHTFHCRTLAQAMPASTADSSSACYVREMYQAVLDAPKKLRLTRPAGSHSHLRYFEGVYERQARLLNGRPVYKAVSGTAKNALGAVMRWDPLTQWWTIARNMNPGQSGPGSEAAMASDAPYPTSGRYEVRCCPIYQGWGYYDFQIEVEDGAAGLAVCGNGVVEDGEECDDGNLTPLDGCSAQCLYDAGAPAVVPPPPRAYSPQPFVCDASRPDSDGDGSPDCADACPDDPGGSLESDCPLEVDVAEDRSSNVLSLTVSHATATHYEAKFMFNWDGADPPVAQWTVRTVPNTVYELVDGSHTMRLGWASSWWDKGPILVKIKIKVAGLWSDWSDGLCTADVSPNEYPAGAACGQ